MLGAKKSLSPLGLTTLIFDEAGERRAAHDCIVLKDSGSFFATVALDSTILVYGLPQSELDLVSLESIRKAAVRVLWLPSCENRAEVERALALQEHLQRFGRTTENRALILESHRSGGLSLLPAVDRQHVTRIQKMIALADSVAFGCDEEFRCFSRRYSLRQTQVAICPLALLPLDRSLSYEARAPIIVAGTAGAFLVREALNALGLKQLSIDEFWGKRMTQASALLICAEAALDPRFLQIAGRKIPVVADVESLFLEYMGPDLCLLPFRDSTALRAHFMSRLLDEESSTARHQQDLAQTFSVSRAGKSWLVALQELHRIN